MVALGLVYPLVGTNVVLVLWTLDIETNSTGLLLDDEIVLG